METGSRWPCRRRSSSSGIGGKELSKLGEVFLHESRFPLELIGGLEGGHDAEVAILSPGIVGFDFVVSHRPLAELAFDCVALANRDDILVSWIFPYGSIQLDYAPRGAFDHLEEHVVFVEENSGDAEAAIVHAGMFEKAIEFGIGEWFGRFAHVDDAIKVWSWRRIRHWGKCAIKLSWVQAGDQELIVVGGSA